ncbi:hypothetical protein BGX28_005673 [Mortierella sp. GBA30]|nr:hypothetical protein BGX28_005673 [Mortierella sp. GBA30]
MYDALYSRALFIGKDISNPYQVGVDTFKEPRNHPTAIASVILHVTSLVDFKPRDSVVITDRDVFSRFESMVSELSVFELVENQEELLNLTGERSQFARETYKKYNSSHATTIAKSFQDLVPSSLISNSWHDFLLSQVIMDKADESNDIKVEIASMALSISEKSTGQAVIDRQKATLIRKKFRVISKDLIEHAEEWGERVYIHDVSTFHERLTSNREKGHPIFGFGSMKPGVGKFSTISHFIYGIFAGIKNMSLSFFYGLGDDFSVTESWLGRLLNNAEEWGEREYIHNVSTFLERLTSNKEKGQSVVLFWRIRNICSSILSEIPGFLSGIRDLFASICAFFGSIFGFGSMKPGVGKFSTISHFIYGIFAGSLASRICS